MNNPLFPLELSVLWVEVGRGKSFALAYVCWSNQTETYVLPFGVWKSYAGEEILQNNNNISIMEPSKMKEINPILFQKKV